MRRREFFGLVGGAAAWPVAARAQQADRVRRIGVLMGWSGADPQYRSRIDVLIEGLAALGWAVGRTLRLDVRWSGGSTERARTLATELVEQRPDVLLAGTTPAAAALQRATRTLPIVFAVVSDPVGAGFVASLSRPGGNMTGFINIEAAMGGKWLELLKDVAPRLSRVTSMFNPDTAPGRGTFFQPALEAAARMLSVDLRTAPVRSDAEIEGVIAAVGQDHGGLVLTSDSFTNIHRSTIIAAAAHNKVPFISDLTYTPREGGLIAYGPDYPDIFRRAAAHVDRILRGANPAELPVEVPVKFELVINLRTAKSLGLEVPPMLLARADEVIE